MYAVTREACTAGRLSPKGGSGSVGNGLVTTRWNERSLTTAEELAERVPDRLLDLGPYLNEDPGMTGLKLYMNHLSAWIHDELGAVDEVLTREVMTEIGVTFGRWFWEVLSKPPAQNANAQRARHVRAR